MSTGLKKKHLRHVAGALREARDLMNSGGRHWIKGAERMLVDPETHVPGETGLKSVHSGTGSGYSLEPAFCSIGALREIGADELAAVTLAEVIDPEGMRRHRRTFKEDALSEYRAELAYYGAEGIGISKSAFIEEYTNDRIVSAAEDVIIGFNDDTPTTWKDVRTAFTKAAKRLADRAR